VLSQVMGKPHRAIFHEFKGGSSSPTTSKARAT
jgi:2-oxoglutarate dehydrogenase E1 component